MNVNVRDHAERLADHTEQGDRSEGFADGKLVSVRYVNEKGKYADEDGGSVPDGTEHNRVEPT